MISPLLRLENSRKCVVAAACGLLLSAPGAGWAQEKPPVAATDKPKAPAAVHTPPALPAGVPIAPGAPPVAPPLPGQLKATPMAAAPPPAVSAPLPMSLPPLPKGPFTPAPRVPVAKPKVSSSTSTSGQFIVHGDDLQIRSAFSSRCEEIAMSLRRLLRDKEPWALPIVVLLKSGEAAKAPGPAVSFSIAQITHGGFHLQVNVKLRPDLRPSDLRNEVVRVLLAERIVRNQNTLTADRTILPDWVLTGTLEALDFRQRARPSTLFAAIFKSGKIYGIEEIIEASPVDMDALSKTIYQTSCCALVLALLDQPEGNLRYAKFLNSLASDPRTERELLNHWFPSFAASPASLNKWWSLQLAALSSPSMSEPLSPAATVQKLEEALTLRFQAKPSEIPKPRPVAAAVRRSTTAAPAAPAPAPATTTTATATAAATSPPQPAAEADLEPEKKTPWLRRLNPFARRKSSDEALTAAIAEAAQAEAAANQPAAQPAPAVADAPPETAATPTMEPAPEPGRQPLLNRWFGKGGKNAPVEEKETSLADGEKAVPPESKPSAEQPEKKPKDEQKPVPAVKPAEPKPGASDKANDKAGEPAKTDGPEPEPETKEPEARKGPGFNPLKWFRRGNKNPEPEPSPQPQESEPPADKDKKTAIAEPVEKETAAAPTREAVGASPVDLLLFSLSPLAADLYATASSNRASESREIEGVLRRLGFGKKKEKAAEPESPPETAVTPPEGPAKTTAPPDSKPNKSQSADSKPAAGKEEAEPAKATESGQAEQPAPAEPVPPARTVRKIKPLFGGRKERVEAPVEDVPAPQPATTQPPPSKPEPSSQEAPPPAPAPAKPKKKAPVSESPVAAAVPIEAYAAVMKRADRQEIFGKSVNALADLQNRASVLFRPIISDYNELLTELAQGKTKDADARLRALRARTAQALEMSKAVRDALDLFEANESPAYSGKFDDFLALPETIKKELPERTDPISKYLDALDKEFSSE